MESITFKDSPLATEYEGEGQHDYDGQDTDGQSTTHPDDSDVGSPKRKAPAALRFAPRGPARLRLRVKNLPKPVSVKAAKMSAPLVEMRDAVSHAVNSRIGRAENAHFIEQFRYIIIASQLLNEQTSQGNNIPRAIPHGNASASAEYRPVAISLTGVAVTGIATFALVWLMHWSRSNNGNLSKSKASLTALVVILGGYSLHAYSRRQVLQYLRQEAVAGTNTLLTNLLAFDASGRAALGLIQDVEVVSRGLQISDPMPPITRLEAAGGARHCLRLREAVVNALGHTIPPMLEACDTMRQLVKKDDLERYLGIYEITPSDLQDAEPGFSESEFDHPPTLDALRTLHRRLTVLRRVFLCSLLTLEADGTKSDVPRWSAVVETSNKLATVTGEQAQELQKILNEEDVPTTPRTPSAQHPTRKRAFSQARKLSGLSRGVRDLQSKVQLLREDSMRMLESETSAEEVAQISQSLMTQYEALGSDLKNLMNAWEAGKSSLALSISRNEKRVSSISQRSSGLRSPVPSLGGITAVDENEGSPSDALRSLEGVMAKGMSGSRRSSTSGTEGSREDYEEVYEAIAIPRLRPNVTREERIRKMEEDRERTAAATEARAREDSLMKELNNVISRKPAKPAGQPDHRHTVSA